jgi:hypothetical protein
LAAQQAIELATALKGVQVVTAAKSHVVDKNLGNTGATGGADGHLAPGLLIAINPVFAVNDALAVQERLGTNAIGAELPGVDLKLR